MTGCVLVHGIRINKSCPRVDTINRSVRDVSTLSNFYGLYVCIISEEVITKCTEKKNETIRNLATKTCSSNILVPTVLGILSLDMYELVDSFNGLKKISMKTKQYH